MSIRWKNITARAALLALLDNFDLQLIENPNAGLARITLKNSDAPQIYASPDLDVKITRLIQNVIGTFGTNMIIGVRGDRLLAKSPAEIKPARIILLSGIKPDPEIIAWFTQCFPTNAIGGGSPRIHIEPPIGTIPFPKTFRVILDSAYFAADYLAWSDQFEPAFDEIREALKRPYAIIPGDYSVPYLMPIPNFVTMRALAQTLAQRAQCDFLLGKPDDALRELTLIHDMCRILEKPPTGKPETLVEAMINVAISGVYVSTIGDGFKLNAWGESQIAILQKQLKETELAPYVVAALEAEQASSSHTLEITPASKIGELFNTVIVSSASEKNKPGIWKKITNPMYLYFKFCPRGWIYQNMVNSVSLVELGYKDGVDLKQDTISPSFFDKAVHDVSKSLDRKTPFNVWAQIAIPNFTKAWQSTAHTQTLVNEAQIACALERYHLAHSEYPETLDTLIPQFIERLPHDIIGGQPLIYRTTDDEKFLLYSVGWNETDDGGEKHQYNNVGRGVDYSQGDWVWEN